MNNVKRIVFALLLAVASFPLSAQEKPEAGNSDIFRFMADKDMFFSPWSGNGKELDRLLQAIDENRTAIESGTMRILVSSCGTTAAKINNKKYDCKFVYQVFNANTEKVVYSLVYPDPNFI